MRTAMIRGILSVCIAWVGTPALCLPHDGLPHGSTSVVQTMEAAAQPPPITGAVRVGGNIRQPSKIQHAAPVYPDIALKARVAGIVIVEIGIDPEGSVTSARVLRGVPLLNAAAIDAVKQWRYEPTLLNGVAVPVIMTVTVNFTLPDAGPASPFHLQPNAAGFVRLGMPLSELRTRVPADQLRVHDASGAGESVTVEVALEPGGQTALVATVDRAASLVRLIDVRHERFRTIGGQGLGSTLADLRATDPSPYLVLTDAGPSLILSGSMRFVLDAPQATTRDELQALPDSTRVTRILIGPANVVAGAALR